MPCLRTIERCMLLSSHPEVKKIIKHQIYNTATIGLVLSNACEIYLKNRLARLDMLREINVIKMLIYLQYHRFCMRL